MIISLDSETTGLDFRHGARPYLVTTCEGEENTFWEWDVDPVTRKVLVDEGDLNEIQSLIDSSDTIIIQNAKFDVHALASVGVTVPFDKIHDTLLASHILSSITPHDLTYLCIQYLSTDISSYEDDMEEVVQKCRRMARSTKPNWRIAKPELLGPKGERLMPSISPSGSKKIWKNDCWLPKAFVKTDPEKYHEEHIYHSITSDYANVDSAVLIPLWETFERKLKERKLWKIYLERRKLLQVVYEMERTFEMGGVGVTMSTKRANQQRTEYAEQREVETEKCVRVAKEYNFDLEMPASGNSNALRSFVFDVMKLPALKYSDKTGDPSLDKETLDWLSLQDDLPDNQKTFVGALSSKRKLDTALSYMESYFRFLLPSGHKGFKVLYPSYNITGSSTLRGSSSNPNGQNVSSKEDFNLRQSFGPPPGWEWWVLDYQNIELRIPAYLANEQTLIDLFESGDVAPYYGSFHLLVAHALHKKEFEKCRSKGEIDGRLFKDRYPEKYRNMKVGNFAYQYGGGEAAVDLGYKVKGGKRMIERLLPNITALGRKCITIANRNGFIETIPDKTVDPERGYPLICPKGDRGVLTTTPLNYKTQGCLAGTSKVLTKKGLIPIKELEGKKTKVWTGFRWASAIGLNRGKWRRARIKLSSGLVIECDTRHKLKNEKLSWVNFSDMRKGMYVALPVNKNPVNFSGEINWAFVVGFIIGDGYLSLRGKRKSLFITVGKLKKDILYKIQNLFNTSGMVGDHYGRSNYGLANIRTIKARNGKQEKYQLYLESKKAMEHLESLGLVFGSKHDTKKIPEWVWESSEQAQRDFLEGLWKSDGTRKEFSGSGRGLNMKNEILLKEVQILSSALGYDSYIDKKGGLHFRWRAFNAKSSRKYPAFTLTSQASEVNAGNYAHQPYYITDKRNYKAACKDVDVSQYVAERIVNFNGDINPEIYRYDRIVSIEVLDLEEETYTLSVNDSLHQFVADGVIHKNTAMWCTSKAMVRCSRQCKKWRKSGEAEIYMFLQVHDEIDFVARANQNNYKYILKLKKLMEKSGDDVGVKLPVSVSYHPRSWAEKEKWE